MEIYLVKQADNSFKVAYGSDYEKIKKIKEGRMIKCEISAPRNMVLHRKFFSLINLVYKNQEKYNNKDKLREDLIINAGFFDEIIGENGIIKKAKSISIEKMNQDEFDNLYNRVLDEIAKTFNFNKESTAKEVEKYY